MTDSQEEFLSLFGWNSFFENHKNRLPPSDIEGLLRARVIGEEKGLYRLQLGLHEILPAIISGKMQNEAQRRTDYPAVGDWVLAEVPSQCDRAVIRRLLPRQNLMVRKEVGAFSDVQILSTNLDYLFVATSFNEDLNLRRLERYLALAYDSGAVPVILLTKSDLCPHQEDRVRTDIEMAFPGVDVHGLSKDKFQEASFLAQYLRKGTTSALLGSSGVGKSTLVNFLIGSEKLKTQEIREGDHKGKHTTTSRHLFVTSFGGLIIDTPGMRELHLTGHEEGPEKVFSEIDELKNQCRFFNCHHLNEPNCAIKAALEDGSLSPERWKNYGKLLAEVQFEMRKQDKALASAQRKAWKKKRSTMTKDKW